MIGITRTVGLVAFLLASSLLCTGVGPERDRAQRTASLWGALEITVPRDVRPVPLQVYNLSFGSYAFISARDDRVVMIAYLDVFRRPSGFLSSRETASAVRSLHEGMPMWRTNDKAYVRLQARLPKPLGCSVQTYVLFVLARQDDLAARMIQTLRPVHPYRCFKWVP